ncbi:hypothetical protein KC660_02225 [Candidatus Dojkabacteria bacterium]|uniref:Bacterial Ig domain-containing protein n=1 Tax=Candidatus Dojkabacteria bacterium TaxID=2099670 RepID=A0A955L3I1_9BACT|nr:hypothetical protein [Candidatus Dojkabacteria bacterium]
MPNIAKASGPSESWMRAFGSGNSNDGVLDVNFDSNNNLYLLGKVANYNGNPYSPGYYDADLNDDGDALDTGEQGISTAPYNTNLFLSSFNPSNQYRWSRRFLNDSNAQLEVDTNNHLIVFAVLGGSQDLNADGDTNDTNESSGGLHSNNDMAVTTFDSNGNYLWSERYGSASHDSGEFSVDSDGNIIIAGVVNGDADLTGDNDADDGQGESSTGYGDQDLVIISISPTGVRNWSKRIGGTSADNFLSILVGSDNNVYISGTVINNADLNGDGDTLDAHETDGTGNFTSIFDQSGNFVSTLRVGGDKLNTDDLGNLIIASDCIGNIDLSGDGDTDDSGELATGYGLSDICISSFDKSNLNYNWSKRLGSTVNDDTRNLLITNSGNKIVLGMYASGDADLNSDGDSLDGGAESQGLLGGRDQIVVVLDSDGNYQWSKRLGTAQSDNTYGFKLDSQDTIYIAQVLQQDLDADLNGDGDITDSADGEINIGHIDLSLSAFDVTGNFQFAKRFGTTGQEFSLYLGVNSMNDIVLFGDYSPYLAVDINGDGDMTDGTIETGADTYKGLFVVYFQTANHISIDNIAPTGSISINGGDAYTSSANVILTLSATDTGSGVSQMMISNSSSFSGATWETYSTTKAWSLISGNGTKTVYVKYKDNDSNISSAYSDSIILDSTVPEVSNLTVNGETVGSEDTTITVIGEDSVTITGTTSPNTSVTITIENLNLICNTTSDSGGNFSCSFDNLSNGSYTVTVRVTNGSGSYSEFSFVLGIGTTLPETSIRSTFLIIGLLFLLLASAELIYIKKFVTEK